MFILSNYTNFIYTEFELVLFVLSKLAENPGEGVVLKFQTGRGGGLKICDFGGRPK